MKERVREIDYAKGMGILLVMFGHSMTLIANPFNTFILAFHMPLFFFLSGMTIKCDCGIGNYIFKRLRRIGVGIIISELVYIIVGLTVDIYWKKRVNIHTFDYLKGFDNWFLISLFFASIAAYKIIEFKRIWGATVSMVVALLLWGNYDALGILEIAYLKQTLLAFVFIVSGAYFGTWIVQCLKNYCRTIIFEIIMICIIIISIVSSYNGPCAMAGNIYGKIQWLFVLSSYVGIILILALSVSAESKILALCGRNSLIIFTTHFGAQKLLIAVWESLRIHNYMDYPYYFIMFCLLLAIEIPVALVADKKCRTDPVKS